jgi:hypothetical protein
MSRTYHPALAQYISGPDHRPTGRPRRAYAIYAADGTLLDVVPYDEIEWPQWILDLTQLVRVNVTATEFASWLKLRAV